MSESYAVSEKRELLLDKVKKFILDNGGIVKKSQLAGLGIDYRRILDFVEKGDILRVKSGYYAVHLSDYRGGACGKAVSGLRAESGECVICVWLYQKETVWLAACGG